MLLKRCHRLALLTMVLGLLFTTSIVALAASPQGESPVSTPSQLASVETKGSPSGSPAVTPAAMPQNQMEAPGEVATYSGPHPLILRLKYVKADQVKPLLVALMPDNRIRVEFINSRLIVLGSEDDCDQVKNILAQIDVPPRQVMFEAEAVELSRDDVKNIGINWGASTPLPEAPGTDGSVFRINLGIPNHPEYGVNLKATINRLIENKKGRLLASPRIAALDGQTAQILIGDRLAVESTQVVSGSTLTSVTYVEVGIKLEVSPTVNEEDGTITTRIKPEVSNKTDTTTAGNPNIRTRQAETTLRVKSGETIVLGGLIQRQETKDVVKVPLLGDIPFVGHFFRSTITERIETELVILITPKMID